jgi:hypothetical protein
MKINFLCILLLCSTLQSCGFSPTVRTNNKTDVNSKIVFHGQVEINDGKLELGYWTRGKRPLHDRSSGEEFSEFPADIKISLEIVNCAGYLASVNGVSKYSEKAKKNTLDLKIIPESVAPDVIDKIKQCDGSPNSLHLSSGAFAIEKELETTKNIKPEKTDLRQAFSSLPLTLQSWANCEREEKDTISINKHDDWADINNDGEIDLILLNGACQGNGKCENKGGYTCSRILLLINESWIEIAYSKPA